MIEASLGFNASLIGNLFGALQQPLNSDRFVEPPSSADENSESHGDEHREGSGFKGSSKQAAEADTRKTQRVQKLQQRDREVRAHEQAHVSAGGGHVNSGPKYTYTKGPDGKQYATEGTVDIDTSEVSGDPKKTEEKARAVRKAALAPSNPSSQDQQVAAKAAVMEMQARMEQSQKRDGTNETASNPGPAQQRRAARGYAQGAALQTATTPGEYFHGAV